MAGLNMPIGFRFSPKEKELVGHYLVKKNFGGLLPYETTLVKEYDLYGLEEPFQIYDKFRGQLKQPINKDLFFFSKLKKKTAKGSKIDRNIGNGGTWHGEDSAFDIPVKVRMSNGTVETIIGKRKRFTYRNSKSDQHKHWIMMEYSLDMQGYNCDYVICKLRKNESDSDDGKKRKRVTYVHEDIIENMPVEKKSMLEKAVPVIDLEQEEQRMMMQPMYTNETCVMQPMYTNETCVSEAAYVHVESSANRQYNGPSVTDFSVYVGPEWQQIGQQNQSFAATAEATNLSLTDGGGCFTTDGDDDLQRFCSSLEKELEADSQSSRTEKEAVEMEDVVAVANSSFQPLEAPQESTSFDVVTSSIERETDEMEDVAEKSSFKPPGVPQESIEHAVTNSSFELSNDESLCFGLNELGEDSQSSNIETVEREDNAANSSFQLLEAPQEYTSCFENAVSNSGFEPLQVLQHSNLETEAEAGAARWIENFCLNMLHANPSPCEESGIQMVPNGFYQQNIVACAF